MEKAQIIRKKRPAIIITVIKRQNSSEKEIPFSYSVEKENN
jgi:hypothetical protein